MQGVTVVSKPTRLPGFMVQVLTCTWKGHEKAEERFYNVLKKKKSFCEKHQ